jgi:hypothetical protein
MTEPLQPKAGFDWTRVQWTGPYALVEWERCSYCGSAIPEEGVPLRMWNDEGWAAVFCDACMREWWGMESFADDPNDYGDEAGFDDE